MSDVKPVKGRKTKETSVTPEQRKQERRDRFNRLHVPRVRNALRTLRNVERMANVHAYDYTPDEAVKLVEVIEASVKRLKAAFTGAPKERGLYDL